MEEKIKQLIEQYDKDGLTHEELMALFNSRILVCMKKSFEAGADKRNWTKVRLTGVGAGREYIEEPMFEEWLKKLKN